MNTARYLLTCSHTLLLENLYDMIKKTPRYNKIGNHGKSMPARDAEIVQMYKKGSTLAKIGDVFSITRERVRQIVARHAPEEMKIEHEVYKKLKRPVTKGTIREIQSQARYSEKRKQFQHKMQVLSDMWVAGIPVEEIANFAGITVGSFITKTHRYREYFPVKRDVNQRTDDQKNKLKKMSIMWNAGFTSKQIAKKFYISANYMDSIAVGNRDLFPNKTKHKLTAPPAKPIDKPEQVPNYQKHISKISEMWRLGATKEEIAGEFDISVKALSSLMSRNRSLFPLNQEVLKQNFDILSDMWRSGHTEKDLSDFTRVGIEDIRLMVRLNRDLFPIKRTRRSAPLEV